MEKKRNILLLVTFFFALANSTVGIFLPLFYLSRGFLVSQIILLLCLTFAVMVIAPLFFVGRGTMPLGLLFYSVFYLAARSAPQPAVVGVAYGLAMAFFWPAYNRLSYRLTTFEDRASFLGTISAVTTATSIAGVVLGGFIAASLGLGALLIAASVIHLVSFFLASAFLADLPAEDEEEFDTGLFFADRNFFLFLASYFVRGFTDSGWIVYPLLLARLTADKTSSMGLASAFVTLAGAAMLLAAGFVSDRIHKRKEFLLLAVPFQAIWHAFLSVAKSVSQVVGFSLFSGISGALISTEEALYADAYEKRHHPLMLALRESFLNIGRLASVLLLSGAILSADFSLYYKVLAAAAFLYLPVFLAINERHSYA